MSEKDTLIARLEELVPFLLSVAQAKGNIPNDLAYDVIQDIAVGLLARSPTFRDQQHFKAYITRVFYYRILDRVKISGKFTSLDNLSEESVSPSQEKMTSGDLTTLIDFLFISFNIGFFEALRHGKRDEQVVYQLCQVADVDHI